VVDLIGLGIYNDYFRFGGNARYLRTTGIFSEGYDGNTMFMLKESTSAYSCWNYETDDSVITLEYTSTISATRNDDQVEDQIEDFSSNSNMDRNINVWTEDMRVSLLSNIQPCV